MNLPAELSVLVAIKIGQGYSNSRTTYGAPVLMRLIVAEGASIFREKVNRQISVIAEIAWGDDSPVLLRPSANVPQSRYEALAERDDEFQAQLVRQWRCAGRRQNGHADFVLDLFVYASKVGNQNAIRRATGPRVETSTTLINEHITRTATADAYGPASRRYWATTHARQLEGTPVVPPESVTFDQLQTIDIQQRAIDAAADARIQDPEYIRVRCRIKGGVVSLDLNLEDACHGLSLPSYSLRPPYRPPVNETAPVINMNDDDHPNSEIDDEDSEMDDQLI